MERSEGIVELVCKCPPLLDSKCPQTAPSYFCAAVLRSLPAIVINQFVRFFFSRRRGTDYYFGNDNRRKKLRPSLPVVILHCPSFPLCSFCQPERILIENQSIFKSATASSPLMVYASRHNTNIKK